MSRQLPTIILDSVRFIIDERLKEIRNLNNPHYAVSFDDLNREDLARVRREIAFYNRPTGQHK